MELYRQRDSQRPRYIRDHQAERDAAAWQKVRKLPEGWALAHDSNCSEGGQWQVYDEYNYLRVASATPEQAIADFLWPEAEAANG